MQPLKSRSGTLFVAALCSASAVADPGDLDASFGSGGTAFSRMSSGQQVVALGIDAAQRLTVVAGCDGKFDRNVCILRLRPDGSADSEFGRNGRVMLDIDGDDRVIGADVDPGGHILVSTARHIALLDEHGARNPGFGAAGVRSNRFPGELGGIGDFVGGFARFEPDGAAVQVSGTCRFGIVDGNGLCTTRLDSSGSVHTKFFGNHGEYSAADFGDSGASEAVGLSGPWGSVRLINFCGTSSPLSGPASICQAVIEGSGRAIPTDTGSTTMVDVYPIADSVSGFAGEQRPAASLDSSGRTWVAGICYAYPTPGVCLAAYRATGLRDPGFGDDGLLQLAPWFAARGAVDLNLDGEDRAYVVGFAAGSGERHPVAVHRVGSSGAIDSAWRGGQPAYSPIGATSVLQLASGIDTWGRIVVAYTCDSPSTGLQGTCINRFWTE